MKWVLNALVQVRNTKKIDRNSDGMITTTVLGIYDSAGKNVAECNYRRFEDCKR